MLITLRSALYLVWLVGTLLPYSIVFVLTAWLLPYRPRYRFATGWNWLAIMGAKWICGIRWRVEGMENLPQRPVLFLVKHQSAWETMALSFLLKRPISYVFKRELQWIPFLAGLLPWFA